jgi:hypothetical protein
MAIPRAKIINCIARYLAALTRMGPVESGRAAVGSALVTHR